MLQAIERYVQVEAFFHFVGDKLEERRVRTGRDRFRVVRMAAKAAGDAMTRRRAAAVAKVQGILLRIWLASLAVAVASFALLWFWPWSGPSQGHAGG